ncbi:MAG: hypothetical protein EBZ48_02205 [Proteobacteria bacterium]|nr:hypothetical protein [Pseudomonadota bacterium]
MLIRASGTITAGLSLLTLGASSRYLLSITPEDAVLFNPGCSAQVPALLNRLLVNSAVTPKHLSTICITHIEASTVAAAIHLKNLNPSIQVIGAKTHRVQLEQSWGQIITEDLELRHMLPSVQCPELPKVPPQLFDRYLGDGEAIELSQNYSLRCIYAPGSSEHACAYLIEPLRCLIVDSVAGYFRGRNLPGPGTNYSVDATQRTLERFEQLDIAILCLPFLGALSGEMIGRHLASLRRVLVDVTTEASRAYRDGIPEQEILTQVRQGLFTCDISDPFLSRALQQAEDSLWRQIKAALPSSRSE